MAQSVWGYTVAHAPMQTGIYLFLDVVLASLTVCIVGTLILPQTAGGLIIHDVGQLLGKLADALDR